MPPTAVYIISLSQSADQTYESDNGSAYPEPASRGLSTSSHATTVSHVATTSVPSRSGSRAKLTSKPPSRSESLSRRGSAASLPDIEVLDLPSKTGLHSPRATTNNGATKTTTALDTLNTSTNKDVPSLESTSATLTDKSTISKSVPPAMIEGVSSFGEELSLTMPGVVIMPEQPAKPAVRTTEVTYSNIDLNPAHTDPPEGGQTHSRTISIDFATQAPIPKPRPPPVSNGEGSGATATNTTSTLPADLNVTSGSILGELPSTNGKEASEKIARLSRLAQGLKQKVERLQGENVQLEEMLAAADAAHRGGSGEISRLEDELAREQAARISLEAALTSAVNAKESEMISLRHQLEETTTRAATLADALAAKEAEKAAADAERSVSESHLIISLRKEIEAAEATLEEERKAHAAARRVSATREQELDATVADAAASLAEMQRIVDERTAKAAVVEERCRELEHELDAVSQKVIAAEARVEAAGGSDSGLNSENTSSPAAQRIQELEAALAETRLSQSIAQDAAASASEECTRLRAEVETLRRQLTEARSSDSAELRKRLQEATDALYAKQAQLERAAADRSATQLQLERQMSAVSVDTLKRRTAAVDRMLSGAEDGYGIVPMDSLGDAYTRLANAPGHLGHAVKAGANFLDSTASQTVRILRHYPLARLAVFVYFIGMHFFIYLLLHRLQKRAFSALLAAEEAAAIGHHSG